MQNWMRFIYPMGFTRYMGKLGQFSTSVTIPRRPCRTTTLPGASRRPWTSAPTCPEPIRQIRSIRTVTTMSLIPDLNPFRCSRNPAAASWSWSPPSSRKVKKRAKVWFPIQNGEVDLCRMDNWSTIYIHWLIFRPVVTKTWTFCRLKTTGWLYTCIDSYFNQLSQWQLVDHKHQPIWSWFPPSSKKVKKMCQSMIPHSKLFWCKHPFMNYASHIFPLTGKHRTFSNAPSSLCFNRTTRIRHQCRKMIVLSCHRSY